MKLQNIYKYIILYVVLFVSIFTFYMQIDKFTTQSVDFQKQILLKQAQTHFLDQVNNRAWNAKYGGVYVKPINGLKPNKYLKDNLLVIDKNSTLIKINPAWMTRQLSELSELSENNGYHFKITSLKPINPNNKVTDFERKALLHIEKTKSKEFYEIDKNNNFNYMGALITTKSCLSCHKEQGYKLGELRGGISINLNTHEYQDILKLIENEALMAMLFIILFLTTITILIHRQFKSNEILKKMIKVEIKKNSKIQDELFKVEKLASMSEMIGNIAHQWRQPLSVISTASSGIILQKEVQSLTDEFLLSSCNLINDNVVYLSNTIEEFSSLIKGNKVFKVFNLKNNVKSFLSLVDKTIQTNHIHIVVDIKDDIQISSHPNELRQCLINIFNNSVDAIQNCSYDNRYFLIKAYIEEENVVIEFMDTGDGIPNNILSKIFEPYFTTKHKSQGKGLGLHMTYKLVTDILNGKIEAKNSEYDFKGIQYKGAMFRIIINKVIDNERK